MPIEAFRALARDQKILITAMTAHMANRAYCIGIGDSSQKPWEEAEQWQRDSAISGVEFALTNSSPGAQHEKWREDKIRAGWTHGPVKDSEKKTHPALLPFSDLPEAEKKKDEIFITTVRSTADALELHP